MFWFSPHTLTIIQIDKYLNRHIIYIITYNPSVASRIYIDCRLLANRLNKSPT